MNDIPTCRLKVKLDLLSTDEGGRQTAIREEVYRPQFHLGSSSASCRVDVIEGDTIQPGRRGTVEMTLLHPERFGAELRRGSQFEIREGSRVVGKGMIEVVKGQEVAPRPGITDRRAQLLNLIREGGGLSRKEILERMGLKGDKSGEKSISRVLTALTRDDRIRRKEGKYYPVGNTGATNDPISSHL